MTKWWDNVHFIKSNHFSPDALAIYKIYKSSQHSNLQVDNIHQSKTPQYKIQKLLNPNHPACGQFGLFTTRSIPPYTHILNYVGYVHTESESDITSDYDIKFISLAHDSLSIDALKMGNEARFINDYRGILFNFEIN